MDIQRKYSQENTFKNIITKKHNVIETDLDKGLNFFITGSAGCGKSYLLNALASSDQLIKNIEITLSTGKAAHQIKGMTIHSFAGIKVGTKPMEYYYNHMTPDVFNRWRNTHVLIINEISMINAQTFDLLHNLACKINQCYDELFGGIQVIVCGDFYQLPPVKGDYVFKSTIWKQYMHNVLELTECFRQKKS
ncbi:ATP-dependent DNA helicase PIF1-like [Hydra vulgaris]|uniref:ATP-dependent DNA helicase PIF1-like n=1 Tax=Hydra vulgaris TaxID=6087 RepID=UPI0032E9BF45